MGPSLAHPDPLPDALAPRRLRRSLAVLAMVAVTVAGAIALMPGVGDVRRLFANADAGWIVLGVALEMGSALAYVVAFRRVFCTEMSWSASYKIAMAELGAGAVLPVGGAGGLALGAWALRRGGMPPGEIGRKTVAFFLVTSAPSVGLLIVLGLALAVGVVPGGVGLRRRSCPSRSRAPRWSERFFSGEPARAASSVAPAAGSVASSRSFVRPRAASTTR